MSNFVYLNCNDENGQSDLIPIPVGLVGRSGFMINFSDFGTTGTKADPFEAIQTGVNLVTCKAITDLTKLVEYIYLRKNEWPAYEQQFKQNMIADPRQLFFLMNAQHLLEYQPLGSGEETSRYAPLDSDNPFLNDPNVSDLMEYLFKLTTDITDKLVENGTSDDVLMQVLGIPAANKPTEQEIEAFLTNVDAEVNKLIEQDKREAEQEAQNEIAALQQQSS